MKKFSGVTGDGMRNKSTKASNEFHAGLFAVLRMWREKKQWKNLNEKENSRISIPAPEYLKKTYTNTYVWYTFDGKEICVSKVLKQVLWAPKKENTMDINLSVLNYIAFVTVWINSDDSML